MGPVSQPAKRLARMNGEVAPPAPPSSGGADSAGGAAAPPPAPEGMSDEARAAKQAAAKAAKEVQHDALMYYLDLVFYMHYTVHVLQV